MNFPYKYPEEIPGWFPHGNQKVLQELIAQRDVRHVVEVGVYCGRATVWFASQPRIRAVLAVDTFRGNDEPYLQAEAVKNITPYMKEIFYQAVGMFAPSGKIAVAEMTSQQAADQIRQSGVLHDLVYIDASHKYEDVAADLAAWWPLTGKVLCGDDYEGIAPGVVKAVNEFAKTVPVNLRIGGRFWWAVKP